MIGAIDALTPYELLVLVLFVALASAGFGLVLGQAVVAVTKRIAPNRRDRGRR